MGGDNIASGKHCRWCLALGGGGAGRYVNIHIESGRQGDLA